METLSSYNLNQKMIKQCFLEEVKSEQKVAKTSGKTYTACSLKIDGKWHNGFGNKSTQAFQQGQTVELDIYSEDYQGKTYWKFKTVNADDKKFADFNERLTKLEEKVQKMADYIKNNLIK